MSRVIKFRVWDDQYKGWTYPCEGRQIPAIFFAPDGTFAYSGLSSLTPENAVVEQFTGLKDRDEREIYEGDIVEITCYDGWKDTTGYLVRYEVKWSMIEIGWRGFRPSMGLECAGVDLSECPILIGNIHENSDLLS